MATRFHSTFPTFKGETFKIYIDDSAFAGSSTEVTLIAGGFRLQIGGDGKNRLNPINGSRVSIGVLVNEDIETVFEAFADDLIAAAEGRFTVRVDFNDGIGADELYWIGYVLPDLSGFQDLAPAYTFTLTATDGIGRLKGIEYKDDSGINTVPYGKITLLQHLLNCLNEDPLSALYFNASTDIFLKTVVNWVDANIGTPTAAKCPLAYARVSGEVFAARTTANAGDTWKYKSCYDVIRYITEHFGARIYFSGGAYRFEQINERAADNYPERRFSRNGTLISSTLTAFADKLIHNTQASHKVATVVFNYLPALRQVSVKYDHNTNRNYIGSLTFKWYKDSQNNDPFAVNDVKFDADSYFRISGRVYFDLSEPTYTEPWRYVFGMDVTLSDGKQLRSLTKAGVDGSGNPINIIIHESPIWDASSADYEISTDFNYTNAVNTFVDFAVVTPVVPSGVDGFTVDFYPKGGFDNQDNNHSVTVNNWKFSDLVLLIVGVDDADNYELDRDYKVFNTDAGNSDTLSFTHIFGHAVKKWTPTKLETSANGTTWLDTTQSWRVGTDTTNYEFGQLFATEVMAGQTVPLKILDGSLGGTDFYPHVRIVTNDDIGWLMMSGELNAQTGIWNGTWFQAGTNRSVTHGPIIRNPHIPPLFGGGGPGQYNTGSGVKGSPGGTAEIALATQATNYLSSAVAAGTVTSIPLQYPVKANAYLANDDIFLVNPQTGRIAGFTVASTAADGDTSLSVVSATLDTDMPKGAYLLYSVLNKYTGEGGNGMNLPPGTPGQILIHGTDGWEAYSGTVDGNVLTWDTTNGWQEEAPTVGGGGTVTSVGLSLPAIFSVSGSPVTTSGTLTATLATQSANLVFAGPTTGSPAAPAFRALVANDIPNLDAAKITTGTFSIARGGTGLSALGTALQLIRVNAGATALEYFTPTYISGNQTITLSGDVTGSGATSITTTIAANAVTDAKFRQSTGLSVVGRSANTTGNVADITAANDGEVLRRSGTTLGFGTVATAGLANSAVTYAKIQNVTALRLLGNPTGSAAAPAEIALGATLSFSGSTLQTGAMSGDVTSAANSFATTIATNVVTFAKMQTVSTGVLLGRSTAGTGNIETITIGSGLSLSGGVLSNSASAPSGTLGQVAWFSATNTVNGNSLIFLDNTNQRVGISQTVPSYKLHVNGLQGNAGIAVTGGTLASFSDKLFYGTGSSTSVTYYAFKFDTAASGANVIGELQNTNNSSVNSHAYLRVASGGASGGDPFIQLQVLGGQYWSMGIDNSDSSAFVISSTTALGTANRLRISTSGNVSINSGSQTAIVNIGGSGATSATYAMLVNNSSGSSIFALRDDRRVGILNPVPTQELDVAGDVIARQYINTSAAPTLSSFGTGAGTGPVNNSLTGGVNFFRFQFTTGTSPTANGDIFTLLVNQAFPSIPIVCMTPASQSAAAEWTKFYISGAGGNALTVKANGTLTASTSYQINFIVGGY